MSAFKYTTASMLQLLDDNVNSRWEKEKALLMQNIQFLNATIAEYAKREDDNKKINEMLMELLNNKETAETNSKQVQLMTMNNELRQEINTNKRMHEQIIHYYENQIKVLKQEVDQKIDNQRKLESKNSELQNKVSSIISQNLELEKRIQQLYIQISELKQINNRTQQRVYSSVKQIDHGQTTRRDTLKDRQLKSMSSIQSRINSTSDVFKTFTDDIENNSNEANRMQKVRSYMKKGKGQIKLMMSTLLKTKGQLEEGYQNMTYLAQRQSLAKTGSKVSKSFHR